MSAITEKLTQKLGPLPVWAYGLAVGAVAVFVVRRNKANGANVTTVSTGEEVDPNAINNAPDWYVNPPQWYEDAGQDIASYLDSNMADIAGAVGQGIGAGLVTDLKQNNLVIPVGLSNGGQPPVQKPLSKPMTWAKWNEYHAGRTRNWAGIASTTRQAGYYSYLLAANGGKTVNGEPIPSINSAALAAWNKLKQAGSIK